MIVEVGVRELRGSLSRWLERVRGGDEVIVTTRGRPVARLVPMEPRDKLQELIEKGLVTPAKKPWKPVDYRKLPRMRGDKSLSDIVIEQRRSRDY